jgi:hypothetical protein
MITQRVCGNCSACCEIIGVPALTKPELCKCYHQCETGCAIYANRPDECREFECGWSVGHLDEDDRPDKLGLIFVMTENGEAPGRWLHVLEVRPGAFDEPKAPSFIRQFFLDLAKRGDIAGLEIKLHGQIGIVVHANDLDSMEQLVEEYRDQFTIGEDKSPMKPGN